MAQPVAFSEVISPDQERAQEFYNKLFGWQGGRRSGHDLHRPGR